jgi:hypothetical protein
MCEKVLMVATDAVFTTAPLDIKATPAELEGVKGNRPVMITPNNELGGWDFEVHSSIHIIMPGVYFKGDGDTPKTRGVPRQNILEYKDEFLRVGAALVNGTLEMAEAEVTVPLVQFQGLRVTNHRGRPDLAGEWLPCGPEGQGKTIRYRWTNKRDTRPERVTINGAPALLTMPYTPRMFEFAQESLPYSKDIGNLFDSNEERLADKDKPDWADVLIIMDLNEDTI